MDKEKTGTIIASIAVSGATVGLLLVLLSAGPLTAIASESARPPVKPLAPGDVLINEFIATPTGAEAIELYNTTGADIDVGDWAVDWVYGSTTINVGQTVPAGGYLVLDGTNTGGLSISNDGTVLSLISSTVTIDSVGYGDDGGAPKPAYNFSAGRSPDGTDTGDDAADFSLDTTPTMGAANDHSAADLGGSPVRINEIMPNNVGGEGYVEFIELYNDSDVSVDVGGYSLHVDDDYYIPAGVTVTARGYYTISGATIYATAPYLYLDDDGDNLYLYDDTGVRIDQVGWDGRNDVVTNGESFQRIPDGAGPYDGYSWSSSGGDVTLFQVSPTMGASNDFERYLEIRKAMPTLVNPGDLFTYTITVENAMGFALNDVVITDTVPDNATFAYALDGGVESSGVITWPVTSLPHMGIVTARFAVTATSSLTYIVNADYAVAAANHTTPTAGLPVLTLVDTESALAIHHIQGAGHLSPLNGQSVSGVRGIVTARRWNGFYMQDPAPDGEIGTSEALFVYTGSGPAVDVGDEVLVDGTVNEFRNYSAHLSMTRIEDPMVVVSSTGNALPGTIFIGTGGRVPPQHVIDDDAMGNVETSGTFDPTTDGIDFYESLEAMLVQVNDAVVVGPTNYGVIGVVGDGGANADLLAPRGGLVIRPDDFNPERILIDDAIISSEPNVNIGATFTKSITGVIDYNDYTGNFNFFNVDPLPGTVGGVVSETIVAPTANQLRVASFNVYNLDPGDSAARIAGMANQIIHNLQAPDIIGLQEIQDNSGATDDGVVDATQTYTTLIAAIEAAGGPTYDFREISPENNQDGGAPGGNIRVGFLFRTDRGVSFVDRPGGDATTAVTVSMGVTGVELSASPGRIDPTNEAFTESRKSLAGEFLFNGRKLFVIVNHLKSKTEDDSLYGWRQPPVLTTEAQRIKQAQVLNDFVDSIMALDPDSSVIVLGDLNDFQFSMAVSDTLAADVLTNLVNTVPITEQYTYIYVGNSQVLDHILVSDYLYQNAFVDFDIVHVNTEFAYSYLRPSDHDPVVATFLIEPILSINKTVEPMADVGLGSVVTYTVTIANSGDGDAAGVVMTDELPSEVDFGGWVQQGSALLPPPDNDTITWGPWPVPAQVSYTVQFTATVKTGTALYATVVTNTASFTSDNAGIGSDDAVFSIEEGDKYIYLPIITRNS